MKPRPAAFVIALFAVILPAISLPHAAESLPDGFYRYPSIGGGAIVFAAEGDLWKVPATGGLAMRLTAHEGEERMPKLSPDGRFIAFTAQYEGNDDVYVMPATGGEPVRLTFHPMPDQTLGWTPDGKVLFRSRRDHPHADYRCYTLPPEGGIPSMIPLEPAAWVAFEPKGQRLALQKIGLEFHNWKRYQGGEAEQIEVGTLAPLAFTEVTQHPGKDAFPMWAGDGRIYFVTDRWGRPNLASMKPDGSDVKRLTTFADYDVRWPMLGDGKIVYQHKMDLWVFDLASGKNAQVDIQLPSDRLQVRQKFVDPMTYLGNWGISKDGERIVLETRGDLFVTRTKKKGLIRRITQDSSARSKDPVFSPDGKWIAAWTEVQGEEQILLHSADQSEPARTIGSQPPGWHAAISWSPDGKSLAWGNQDYELVIADAATGKTRVADTGQFEIRQYEWSPDSRFVAYTLSLPNGFSQVRIWDAQQGKVHPVTDEMFNSFAATWDPKGKFLYLLSDRHVNPFLDRFEARFIVAEATRPYVVGLAADTLLPFASRSDVDPAKPNDEDDKDDDKEKDKKADKKSDKKQDAGKKEKDDDEKDAPPKPVVIDFTGLQERLVQVPVPPANYYGLKAVEGKLHFGSYQDRGMMPPGGDNEDQGGTLHTYDLENEKLSTLATGVLGYDVSLDNKVLVYRTKEGFIRVEAGATSAPKDDAAKDARVDLGGWSLSVDPRLEWTQMLREAWRLQRDFFYDVKMHGVDWEGVWKQYGSLADRIASRDDLSDLLGEMFGELSVGHAYYFGGDFRRGKPVGTGLLAADLDYDAASGFWKIRKIFRGDYPAPETSSPLARPDLKIAPGTWLVAIDGRPLVKGEDYLRRLANRAGQEVELSLNEAPKLAGARRVVVKTVGSDTPIRYADWIRETRAAVDRASGGKIGYIHLYDMGGLGLQQFSRDFPPQWNKAGLIMDDRWNHGGFVAPMILAHLDRKLLSIGTTRHGNLSTTPDRSANRYMVTLINRQGGSDCETFAQGFKDFGLGPVIGTRTWGGWVGIRGDKNLRDGGGTTQPEFSGYDPKGKVWQIEGHGVDPDVVLDLPPDGLLGDTDKQLEYATKHLLGEIAKDPRKLAPPPPIIPRPLVPVQ